MIDMLEEESKLIIDSVELKSIFVPKNLDKYLEYIDMMEMIKIQIAKEEQERIIKEKEIKLLKEQEEMICKEKENKNNQEIKLRTNNLSVLYFNLNKISVIDKETIVLKELLEFPINQYINLKTICVELSDELYERLIKFLNSIRIKKEDKELLVGLCKKI